MVLDSLSHGDRSFARAVAHAREAVGISQQEMANAMNLAGFDFHQTTIGKIERGERKATVGEARAIARVLDVSVEDLMEPDEVETVEHLRRLVDASANQLREQARFYEEARYRLAHTLDAARQNMSADDVDAVEEIVSQMAEDVVRDG